MIVVNSMLLCFCTIIMLSHSWFCHFDDDVYLNAPVLVEILEQFSPSERIYIGKISISKTKKLQVCMW